MEKKKKSYLSKAVFGLLIVAFTVCCIIAAPITEAKGTLWSLFPPVIAIGLALITKEVYSSLFVGILSGGIIYAAASGTGFEGTFKAVVQDGLITNLSNAYNVGILVFLVVLGIIVVLMNKAGGSRAYGEWAAAHIKGRRGVALSTFFLGVLIFVDDYFNCLTVGSVMRPITDKHNISRSKLAYLIDSTAAPICIIAPISSWAAAVSGTVEGVNGISLFINTIPYNLYAFLTILMVIFISVSDTDYGPMKIHEDNAKNGDIFTTQNNTYEQDAQPVTERGRVIDLILPVAVLIVFCVVGMIYTGGFFSGTDFVTAFANCDAAYGLSLGSISALIVIIAYYMFRRVLKFNECMDSIAAGFKQMVPAILILTFAWTLKTMTNHLEAGAFVSGVVQSATALSVLLPVILFVVAIGLAFATGTSWGTFGILIPIVTSVFEAELANVSQTGEIPSMVIICISACLAGAVCGDHCSPISDTTIMASTGAQCDHVNHVSTQLPYALTVAAVCVVGYLLSGFVHNVFIVLGFSAALMLAVLFAIRFFVKRKEGRG
ncbi:Na+/H+ antiporter family protein [[Eubacterium] siraeum DSM 15702]|uniref:Na+/H+ antiporter family protein n=1 Tax=[Eubacterium] siraeum DSM 15702 TaxID=428128 RepID=B0MQR7_9FIRM|nr:Na+/H+ antiporter family protein [[Eubacterium] siraeum DSM 15702]UWP25478.1 Na+/H+ antiporter NhaC family protein [[Eubacterium] siraeum]